MVEVNRKANESVGSMLRRFTRRVQQSGLIVRARSLKFYHSPTSKRERREAALYREKVVKERERLWKLGKLEEK